jgi:glycosyltransferase involved in cell wall biosynthesis
MVEFHGFKLHDCQSNPSHIPQSFIFTARRMNASRIDSVFFLSGGITAFGSLLLIYCRMTRRRAAMLLYGKDVLQAKRHFLDRVLLIVSTKLADSVLANSRFTSTLLPFVNPRKVRILYPGVDPTIAGEVAIPSGAIRKRILFVGRLVRRKGLKDLIDAFKVVSEEIPDATLEIVGDGPEKRELEHMVADLGLGGKVSLFGTLRGKPLFERYSYCDVFVMPSVTLPDDVEGFGTVFLEAGLFRKPSVGTTSGGIPEAVEDGRTGLLVPEGNAGELAQALRRLLTDTRLASSLGLNARERVLSKFTWEESTKQLIRSYVQPAT